MAAGATEGASLVLDEDERRRAVELVRFLEAHRHGSDPGDALMLTASDGTQQVLLPSFVNALQVLSAMLARGDDVALIPLDKELSVDEAAALLNISPPFLEKLLNNGAIPSIQAGTQRHFYMRDIVEYRQHRSERNKRLLDETLSFAQEHGGYD